ncbi:MAG: ABC transporter ATP-binding protein [Acidimicrobiia bacterium]
MRIPDATDVDLSSTERRRIIRRTWHLLRPHRRGLAAIAVLVVLQAGGMVAGPALVRYGIDSGVRPGDLDALNRAAALFVGAAVLAYVSGRLAIRAVARVGEAFLRELRERVFSHQLALSMEFFDRNRTGTLVARMTADIEALQELVGQGLTMFVVNSLLLTGAVVVMVGMSWQLALITLLVVPLVAKATGWFRRESNKAYLDLRESIGSNLSTIQEGLAGVRVVQAFNQEDAVVERFHGTNERLFNAHMRTERIAARYFPVIELAQGLSIALVLGLGGHLSARGAVTVGTVAAYVLYLQNLFEPIQQLSQLFNQLQASAASLHKLYGLLDERVVVAERPGAVDLPDRGRLEVIDVSFAYRAGPPVLEAVSLVVEPGERVALVGPTGAGKSTLAKLMARSYDPTAGSVRYAGIDLRDATLASLRRRIVVVPQEGFLFSGSLRDNLLIGRPAATDADVGQAIDRLGLRARFDAFAGGLDAEVRERGANFSAGERQLVSLVRAALADPGMIVLDEATSSLDPGTELVVERALERLMEGRTVVVIAHRLSTAARADRVAVVEGGRLVEHGTHAELMAGGGAYARLFASWAAGVDRSEAPFDDGPRPVP